MTARRVVVEQPAGGGGSGSALDTAPPPGAETALVAQPRRASIVRVDGRCVAADRCPTGQGFYHRAVLAEFGQPESGEGEVDEALVRLTVMPRAEEGQGGANETEFSVVSIVNEE